MAMLESGISKRYKKFSPIAQLSGIAISTRIEVRRPIVQLKMISTSIAPNKKLEPSTRNIKEISSEVSLVIENETNGYCCCNELTRSLTLRAVFSVLISASLLTMIVAQSLPSTCDTLVIR